MPTGYLCTHIYKYPDGEKCADKTLHTVKAWGFWGLWATAYDLIGISSPKTIVAGFSRVMYINVPVVTAAAVFSSGACIIGDLRGKDGPLNHILAGILSGVSIAAYTGHVNMGLRFAAVFAIAGGFCKALHQSTGSILPMPTEKNRELGSFHHYDRYFGPNAPAKKLPPPGYN